MTRPKPWIVVGSERVADCRVFEVEALASRREGEDAEHRFFRLHSVDWVNVIALTREGDVILVRQWRHGLGGEVLEIPGGMVDEGESPAEAAARELVEETGYRPARVVALGSVSPNPAICANRLHTFLAEDCERVQDIDNVGAEETIVELVPRGALDDLVRAGRIDHALVLAALHWWTLRGP